MRQSLKNKIKTVIFLVIAIQLFCFFTNKSILGVIYFDGPYYGRVINAETSFPLEGVAVAGIWKFEYSLIKDIMAFAVANETVTDKNGKFEIPLTFAFSPYPASWLSQTELLVFKPGYDSNPPAIKRKVPKPEWVEYTSPDGLYRLGKWERCYPKQECIVELHKAKNIDEERDVYGKMGFSDIPLNQRYQLQNIITMVNQLGRKFGADQIPLSKKDIQ